ALGVELVLKPGASAAGHAHPQHRARRLLTEDFANSERRAFRNRDVNGHDLLQPGTTDSRCIAIGKCAKCQRQLRKPAEPWRSRLENLGLPMQATRPRAAGACIRSPPAKAAVRSAAIATASSTRPPFAASSTRPRSLS